MRPSSSADIDRIMGEAEGRLPVGRASSSLSARLPALETLAYLEKLGLVVLIGAAIVYLLARAIKVGPMAAGRDAVRATRG